MTRLDGAMSVTDGAHPEARSGTGQGGGAAEQQAGAARLDAGRSA
jgi:hypothetical protein